MSGPLRALGIAGIVLAITSAAAVAGVAALWHGLSVPVVRLPPPSGPYAVGTSVLRLAPNVSVQVWYPAQPGTAGPRAPYGFGAAGGPLRARISAALVQTDAVIDAGVAVGRFPVLLYAPAWGGIRSDNTAHAQNLASHGFLIIAIDDRYAARPMDMSSAAAFHSTLAWAAQKVRLQAACASLVLSAFDRLSADGAATRFAGHADMQRVGMFGFSFGGATAAQAAIRDSRIRAAADLDGWIFADAAALGVRRPFMIVSSSAADSAIAGSAVADAAARTDRRYSDMLDRANLAAMLAGLKRHGGYYLTVAGTDHFNFSDVALLPSLRHRGVGAIDGRRAQAIVAAYLVQFFDHFLNGQSAPLFERRTSTAAHDTARVQLDPAARLEIWHGAAPKRTWLRPDGGS